MNQTLKIVLITLAVLAVLGIGLGFGLHKGKPVAPDSPTSCSSIQKNLFNVTRDESDKSLEYLKNTYKTDFENFEFAGIVSKITLVEKLLDEVKKTKNANQVLYPFADYTSNKFFKRDGYGYEILGKLVPATVAGELQVLKPNGEEVTTAFKNETVYVVPGRIVTEDSSALRFDMIITQGLQFARLVNLKDAHVQLSNGETFYQALDSSVTSKTAQDIYRDSANLLNQDYHFLKDAFIGNFTGFINADKDVPTENEAKAYAGLASQRAFMPYEFEGVEYLSEGKLYGKYLKMTPQGNLVPYTANGDRAYYGKIKFHGMQPVMVLFEGKTFNPLKVVPNSNSYIEFPNKVKVVFAEDKVVEKMIDESSDFLSKKMIVVNDAKKVHFIFMLDQSTSMVGDKWADTKKATLGLIELLKGKHQNIEQDFLITMITFSSDAILRVEGQPIQHFKNATLDGFSGGQTNFEKPLIMGNEALQKYKQNVDVTYAYFFTDGEAFYPTRIEGKWKNDVKDGDFISFLKLNTLEKGDLVLKSFTKNINSPRCTYNENPEAKNLFTEVKKFVGLGNE